MDQIVEKQKERKKRKPRAGDPLEDDERVQ